MRRRLAFTAYVVDAAADSVLAAHGRSRIRVVTKPLLMPTLMVGRDVRTQRALGLCWVGDIALLGKGNLAFSAGLGSFLAGHLAWIPAIRARPGRGLLKRRPVLAVPYVVACVGLNAALWRRTGRDRWAIVAYSAVLTAVALAALDTGRPAAAVGGALFMVSDSLLAVHRFTDVELPWHQGLVMITYTTAQALLSAGGRVSPDNWMSD
jgi:uncharacterized membrane protein YhhN